jgi:hypothetical protein
MAAYLVGFTSGTRDSNPFWFYTPGLSQKISRFSTAPVTSFIDASNRVARHSLSEELITLVHFDCRLRKLGRWVAATFLISLVACRTVRPAAECFEFPSFDFHASPDSVGASGSWIPDSQDGIIAKNPIQTSDVFCTKQSSMCTEARTWLNLGTNHLLAQTLYYRVRSWNTTEVVATLDGATNTIEMRFHLKNKAVVMNETPPGARSPFHAHMDDGSKVRKR